MSDTIETISAYLRSPEVPETAEITLTKKELRDIIRKVTRDVFERALDTPSLRVTKTNPFAPNSFIYDGSRKSSIEFNKRYVTLEAITKSAYSIAGNEIPLTKIAEYIAKYMIPDDVKNTTGRSLATVVKGRLNSIVTELCNCDKQDKSDIAKQLDKNILRRLDRWIYKKDVK